MKYLTALLLILPFFAFSQFRVATIFSDNMVLQRDTKIPIWGWAEDGTQVKMIFNGQTYRTGTANGMWRFTIPPRPAGKRYGILLRTKDTSAVLRNITFGDVWLCGGQSNMEWFTENVINSEEALKSATNKDIRLFQVPHKIATEPIQDIENTTWQICSPKSVKQFSAVGYFFGKNLTEELNIPIGLIGNNYGGTVIETWMSQDAFRYMPVYRNQIKSLTKKDLEKDNKEIENKFKAWLAKFTTQEQGLKDGEYLWKNIDYSDEPTLDLPNQWESSSIDTLKELDGVVWLAKEFTLTKKQADAKTELSLGPVDDSDITWINGIKVGETQNQWNKDRHYSIPNNTLKVGKNIIVVRVEDYMGGGGIYGKPADLFLDFNQKKQLTLAGKWHYKIGYTTTEPMPSGGDFGPNSAPTLLYNGMIAPITKFPIKGVIWYQGETNTYRAVEYKTLKPKWIQNWRKLWNNPNMPIIWVQLANYQEPEKEPTKSSWAELREAQQEALAEPNTAMITAIDIGSAKTIHPLNKQEVGRRLSLAALEEVYGKKTNYKSPRFLKIKKKKRKYIDLEFTDVFDGLSTSDHSSIISGFSIAGKDQVFHWAKAKIIGPNKIRVYTPKKLGIVAIRYAWATNPDPANIINSQKFPLLPFRTDNWKLSTDGITR